MKNSMKIIGAQEHTHLSGSFQLIQIIVFFYLFYSELDNYSLH